MAVSVQLPDLGEEMAGGLVAEWYRADGALVGAGEVVCRVESAFVAFEVEAEGEGTLRHQKPAGSIERPGSVLGMILAPGEAMPAAPSVPPSASQREAPEPGPVALEGFAETFDAKDNQDLAIEDEFEEALREAVVVPFPRRFAAAEPEPWEEAPGDAVEFTSGLWDGAPATPTETLEEPGGSIPGLPLWEPDDKAPTALTPISLPAARFERIASEVAADAQVLQASINIDITEAARLRAVCRREWAGDGVFPLLEDIWMRAVAIALDEAGVTGGCGLVVAEATSDVTSAVAAPAEKTLREAAVVRSAGGDAVFEQAAWTLVSLAALGVASCTARIDHGRRLAFAVGAADPGGRATLTVAFDSLAWSEGSAARLLARIRELFEAPYAMLV